MFPPAYQREVVANDAAGLCYFVGDLETVHRIYKNARPCPHCSQNRPEGRLDRKQPARAATREGKGVRV